MGEARLAQAIRASTAFSKPIKIGLSKSVPVCGLPASAQSRTDKGSKAPDFKSGA
jgi:hypothetical protein